MYTKIQKRIAAEIRKIGGSGNIHGCIIDIDFYNHIYVNPIDMKITGYWASNIINKKVYPSVPALIKKRCPKLFIKYSNLIKEDSKNLPILVNGEQLSSAVLPKDYLDTDIYKVSREIKKMQKLKSNILTTWYEIVDEHIMIETTDDLSSE